MSLSATEITDMSHCSISYDICLFVCFAVQVPDLSFDCQSVHFKEASTLNMAIWNEHIASHKTR